jgi:predicted dehydrogenase
MSEIMTRRDLLKTSMAASAAAALTLPSSRAFAAGSDRLRLAIVGAGSRGTYDAVCGLNADPAVEMVAMADLFQDRIDSSLKKMREKNAAQVKVDPDHIFLGFDAYKKVMALPEVDMVLLTTPPGFRPQMVRAAIEANKHIYMEKPGAVDPVGIRSLMESHDLATQKKLSIVVGTQQRWQPHYLDLIGRVHRGELGDIVGGQAYWHWGHANWHFAHRKPEWSDMEWQIRCWPYFTWLSGDHIVEQHLHNMDIINWAIGAPPVSAHAIGGRQVRTGPEYGNIYDHFAVEYIYPDGIHVMSMSSQIEGSTSKVGERVQCTKGAINTNRAGGYIEDTKGNKTFTYDKHIHSGDVAQFENLIRSIRNGEGLNECKRLAESTMTVILGRMSAYTGRAMKYNWALKSSKVDLTPDALELGDRPVGPIAMPGKTPLL